MSTENIKYDVPVLVLETEVQEKIKNFRFDPPFSNISLATDSETSRIIYLENTGDSRIDNILIRISDSLVPYVSLSTENIDLDIGDSERIELNISADQEEKLIEGQLEAVALDDELNTQASIFIRLVKDYVPVSESCSELSGVICTENQKCDTENIKYASDGVCCIGTCEEIKESSLGKIIGWLIVIGVLGFGVWFYLKKYKKVKSVNDLMAFMKRKQ